MSIYKVLKLVNGHAVDETVVAQKPEAPKRATKPTTTTVKPAAVESTPEVK